MPLEGRLEPQSRGQGFQPEGFVTIPSVIFNNAARARPLCPLHCSTVLGVQSAEGTIVPARPATHLPGRGTAE